MDGVAYNSNEYNARLERAKTESALVALKRAIQDAHVRCLTRNEIIDLICSADTNDEGIDYIKRLQELTLTDRHFEYIVTRMNDLAVRSEHVSSKSKAKIDRTLLRLVRLLPSELASHFAEPFVNHRRKARRGWAYSALRDKRISKKIVGKLLQSFSTYGDQEALHLIARNPEHVAELDSDMILTNIDDRYWRGRVVQALITHNRAKAISLSRIYPFEFAHAAGRSGDVSVLAPLRALFNKNSHDVEFLSIYAYALGKLAGSEELDHLERFMEEKWPDLL